jgi:hypothetical protein
MPAPEVHAIDERIVLIGDTGAPDPKGEPALETLSARVAEVPERTTVVFLGDVVYETGMPEPSALEDTAVRIPSSGIAQHVREPARGRAEGEGSAEGRRLQPAGSGKMTVRCRFEGSSFDE